MSYTIIKGVKKVSGKWFVRMASSNVRPQNFDWRPFPYMEEQKNKITALTDMLNAEALSGDIKWRGGRNEAKKLIVEMGGTFKKLVAIENTYAKLTREQKYNLCNLRNQAYDKATEMKKSQDEKDTIENNILLKFIKDNKIEIEIIRGRNWAEASAKNWDWEITNNKVIYKHN